MKVLIVAKTRKGSRACVGGITFEGRSVRLVAANYKSNQQAGMEYGLGEVWEVEGHPDAALVPPHTENLVVHARRKLGPMTDPIPFIERHMPAKSGGLDMLFDGLARATQAGALYIAEESGVPDHSTMFWRPGRPLTLQDNGKTIRYSYPDASGVRTLAFVGFQTPVGQIPAGTLLRVSLAHWWRPADDATVEPRCYLQLSGWFPIATTDIASGPASAGESRLPDAPPDTTASSKTASNQDPGAHVPSAAALRLRPAPKTGSLAGTLETARRTLKSVFGYDTFRPLQEEIIANLLAGRDSLAIMPTGSGKSLCYQLPALLSPGMTVVISPLIALMQDQVDQLREMGVPAAFLNSSLDYREYVATTERVRQGEVKLLYTSPETLLAPATLALLDRCAIDCLAIDEAHCISEWGHDFRPEYRQLLPVRQRFSNAVCVAFTATATERVQRDIRDTLGFRAENTFTASFNRENLYLEVQPRIEGLSQVLAFLESHRNESGIIYCSTRQGVETLAAQLQHKRFSALPYHAGMEDGTRRQNQALFSRDQVSIIVATIAFGMGIDKSNVRFVLHYNLPESLEHYYQEIGRAGRDGVRADCLLLFGRSDLQTAHRFIDEGAEKEQAGRRARLQAMMRYAEAESCRRKILLDYFGEETGSTNCNFCDNCLTEHEQRPLVDVTDAARKFLLSVKLTGQLYGPAHIIEILRGSQSQELLRRQHHRLPTYGTGRDLSSGQWRRLSEALIRQHLLDHDAQFGGLRLTPTGSAVLSGEPVFVAAEQPQHQERSSAAEHDPALFEALRALRRELATAANVPPYVVFSDRSLIEMATYLPHSAQNLLQVHGVGERKLELYGKRFLEVIRAYCAEHNLTERPHPVGPAPLPAEQARHRWQEVGELFAAGRSADEIQALYDVKLSTVVDHLYRCAKAGQCFDPERLRALSSLSAEEQERAR